MRDIVSPLMGLRSPFGGRVDPYKAAGFRPTLVADMSKDYYRSTSRLTFDTTFTSSRLGNATMVDSDGLLKWGPHNLLTYSEDFSTWGFAGAGTGSNVVVTASAETDPAGGTGAYQLDMDLNGGVTSSDRSYISSSATISSGADYTASVWVKSADASSYDIHISIAGGSPVVATVGQEWQRINTTWASTITSGSVRIGLQGSLGTSDSASVLVYGAHLYRSDLGGMAPVPPDARVAGSTTYVPTTSTAKYLPRRHNHVYNGTAWVDAGTLIETEARTNLITYSQDFTDASWVANDTAPLAVDATGPDGQTSAVTLVDSGATGTGVVQVRCAVTVSTSTTYTASVFAKEDQLSWLALGTTNFTAPANGNVWFDLSTGSIGTVNAGLSGNIEDFGNGWYRCSITFTTDAADTSGNIIIRVSSANAGGGSEDLDGTSSILIYGAQLEAGSTPSSYIPTSGSTVTRAADTSGLTIPAYSTTRTVGDGVWGAPFSIDADWTDNGDGSFTRDGTQAGTTSVTSGFSFSAGKTYIVSITVSGRTAGSAWVYFGGLGFAIAKQFTNGTFSAQYTAASAGNGNVIVSGDANFDGTIDNISVKEAARIAPWPTPRVIGEELVVNGDGSSATGWSDARSNGTVTSTGGRIRSTATAAGAYGPVQQLTGLTVGNVYQYSSDVITAGGAGTYYFRITAVADLNDTNTVNVTDTADFSPSGIFVATNSTMYVGVIHVAAAGGDYAEIDNVSVKEIDPLVVAIQMKGRMDYADTDNTAEINFVQWGSSSFITARLDSLSGAPSDGRILFRQNDGTSNDQVLSGDLYDAGINVPFNIASYHGSTFLNGAVDGTALTADTTPVALPDLSGTDLQIGYDFMGNIEQVRIWVGGITDVTSGNLLISEASA